MPPKAKPADAPNLIDELAADTAPPDDYPPGCPEMVPYLRIRPRSKRAQFKRAYAGFADAQAHMAELMARVNELKARAETGEEVTYGQDEMRAWADMDDYVQRIDDLLGYAAADPEAYRAWADEADDDTLIAAFTVYAARSQPGEASSSAS
jgi:hypothetical protein